MNDKSTDIKDLKDMRVGDIIEKAKEYADMLCVFVLVMLCVSFSSFLGGIVLGIAVFVTVLVVRRTAYYEGHKRGYDEGLVASKCSESDDSVYSKFRFRRDAH